MIRSAWMQFRTQAMVGIGGLVVVAVVLAVTGPHLVHLFDANVAACAAHGDCPIAIPSFLRNDHGLQIGLDALVVVVPGAIGVFWGAPLVARELETGTYRLAWTQSVTRTRWLAVKLGVVGLAGMVVAGLLSLAVTWWSSPIDRANLGVFIPFDQRDLVPVGYAAFAFALGATAGTLLRRTVPAMAATLVAFVAVRLSFTIFLRPHLIAPIHDVTPMNPMVMGFGIFNGGAPMLLPNPPNLPNAWLYSVQIVDNADHALTPQVLADACPSLVALGPGGGPPIGPAHRAVLPAPAALQQALHTCVAKLSTTYHEVTTYQPSSRYWTFQGLETAIYVALAVVLGAGCFWWVRHRLT
jgi:hypothetical protein